MNEESTNGDTPEEVTFSTLQKKHQNISPKFWVKNLPKGISESGIKNLFVTVGKPISISLSRRTSSALIEFQFMNEVELAIRDLNNKPPYKLKVSLFNPKPAEETQKTVQKSDSKSVEKFEKAPINSRCSGQDNSASGDAKEEKEKPNETRKQVQDMIKNLGYDPSIRVRQKKLDFKKDYECVSFGRGYLFMGERDRFVGGLQKFVINSEKCKSKDVMIHYCECCNALTTKMCSNSSTAFCSKVCLVKHRNSSLVEKQEETESNRQRRVMTRVPLISGCIVVITTYLTMQRVFVRRIDESWEDGFSKLCNDVAVAALEEETPKTVPNVGDLVIARYEGDLCFYRAQVCSLRGSTATIFFLDFGNTQETELSDLKRLPEDLQRVPVFATEIYLSGVPNTSSLDSVNYYNKLTAEGVPLILKFNDRTREVVLIDKDSKEVVNEMAAHYALPSWRKDSSVFSKLGEFLKLESLKQQSLRIGGKYNFRLTHFAEKEFMEMEVFWGTVLETDEFLHANSEMYIKIKEYCEFLEGDYYLPREGELCIARAKGEWHRCVNLKTQKTTCCLFFVDDGCSLLVETRHIRKMIPDFVEVPAQAICCTLPDSPELKTGKKYDPKVAEFFKGAVGQTINDVIVLKLMGDAYCLSIPDLYGLKATEKT